MKTPSLRSPPLGRMKPSLRPSGDHAGVALRATPLVIGAGATVVCVLGREDDRSGCRRPWPSPGGARRSRPCARRVDGSAGAPFRGAVRILQLTVEAGHCAAGEVAEGHDAALAQLSSAPVMDRRVGVGEVPPGRESWQCWRPPPRRLLGRHAGERRRRAARRSRSRTMRAPPPPPRSADRSAAPSVRPRPAGRCVALARDVEATRRAGSPRARAGSQIRVAAVAARRTRARRPRLRSSCVHRARLAVER